MLNKKQFYVTILTVLTLCVIMFSGCTLGYDLDTLRKEAYEKSGWSDPAEVGGSVFIEEINLDEIYIGTQYSGNLYDYQETHKYKVYLNNYNYIINWDDYDNKGPSSGYADIKVGVREASSLSYFISMTDNSASNSLLINGPSSGYYIIEIKIHDGYTYRTGTYKFSINNN